MSIVSLLPDLCLPSIFLIKSENLHNALIQLMAMLLHTSTVSNCLHGENSGMPTRSLNKQLQNLREICTTQRGSVFPPLMRENWAGVTQED